MPRLGWWVVAAVVLVIAGVVGGPYVYIHYVEDKAPPPLSVNTTTSGSASATGGTTPATGAASPSPGALSSGSLDGTWKMASGSTAGYRVNEMLFGQSETATGRTTSVTGSLTLADGSVTAGTVSVDLTTVASDRSQRDHQFQTRIMNTSTYPTASFKLTQPIAVGSTPADGVTVTRQVTGDLTLHGTTKSVSFTASIKKTGSTVAVSGSIPVVFADYNIPNPSFAGVVTTDDHGILEFLLNFTQG